MLVYDIDELGQEKYELDTFRGHFVSIQLRVRVV